MGLLMVAAYYFSGEGLGASGALKTVVVSGVNSASHSYAESHSYFAKYVSNEHGSILKTWLIFEILGVIVGGIISAALDGLKIAELILTETYIKK